MAAGGRIIAAEAKAMSNCSISRQECDCFSDAVTSRRQLLLGGLSIVSALSVLSAPQVAAAAKQTSFGFRHGDFEINVISDGYLTIPGEIFTPSIEPDERAKILNRLDTHEGIVWAPTNIPVLRSKSDLILFDIGGGDRYQPSDGRFLQNLTAAGVDQKDVTKIAFTHAHPDHIGATVATDGSLAFPNATYFVGAAEWAYWMDPDFFRKNPPMLHEFGRGAQRDLGAIEDRVVMLKPGDEVVTGIRALDTAGHTPGHLSFEIAGDEGLIIAADAMTSEIIALEHPDWKFGYDILPDVAIKNRKRLIDRVAADKVKVLGFHWTYPGVGFVEAKGSAYRFVRAA
jgi:glyoxylase-like metal-dependent hydrolase (beta-lactamase superfamily II)